LSPRKQSRKLESVQIPDVQYARSGDVAVAYQIVGDGPIDLVFVRGSLADLLAAWEEPRFAQHVEGLASFARVLLFDKRGSGLSDPVRHVPTLEARMDDVRAVLDAAGAGPAVLWSGHEGTRLAILFAATYPERARALVLFDPTARGLWAPDYPWGPTEDAWLEKLAEVRAYWGDREYLEQRAREHCPVAGQEGEFVEWYVWYLRRSASPSAAVAYYRMMMEGDVRDVLPTVRAPTLVLNRPQAREEAKYVADRIPGARMIEIAGLVDGFSWTDPQLNEVMLRETKEFVAGLSPAARAPDRVLATLLFSDIVDSTPQAAALGDSAWRELLERHHAVVRGVLARYQGEQVDSSGDGFFASFEGPGRAIQCARALHDELGALGLKVRIGIHTGECERIDGKLGGIAVPIGARIMSLAGAGDVLVSSTVRDLVAGSGVEFEERGTHELKGVPGEWRLYRVLV
jgi:class 3 adenylate cyclase